MYDDWHQYCGFSGKFDKHCLASHFSSTGKLKQGRVHFITEALSRITSKTFDTSVSSLLENNSRNYSLNTLICENGLLR